MAGIKNDKWIKYMAKKHKMIEPFVEKLISKGKISYGLSSYGYDMRIADEFYIFHNAYPTEIIDPKNAKETYFIKHKGKVCVIPPNSFVLGRSVEYFRIPRNILALVVGKSTYARCGIIVNVTPLESEWAGHVTIEISNTTPLPAKIYANVGIAQVIFLEADEPCQVSYADRKGKYQNQKGIVLPKVIK